MRYARQQFRRALVCPLGMLTPQQAAMVQEKLQQRQVVRSQFPTQEKVATQAAVDVNVPST
jgi:hypothetical protein